MELTQPGVIASRGFPTDFPVVGSRRPVFEKVIEKLVPRVHLGIPHGRDDFLGRVRGREDLAVAPLEALKL